MVNKSGRKYLEKLWNQKKFIKEDYILKFIKNFFF